MAVIQPSSVMIPSVLAMILT